MIFGAFARKKLNFMALLAVFTLGLSALPQVRFDP